MSYKQKQVVATRFVIKYYFSEALHKYQYPYLSEHFLLLVVKNHKKLEPKVYVLAPEKDEEIAKLQLETMDIEIDTMTEEQKKYYNSWEESTQTDYLQLITGML